MTIGLVGSEMCIRDRSNTAFYGLCYVFVCFCFPPMFSYRLKELDCYHSNLGYWLVLWIHSTRTGVRSVFFLFLLFLTKPVCWVWQKKEVDLITSLRACVYVFVCLDLSNAKLSPESCWRGPRSQEVGEEELYLMLHCQHQSDSCFKMGSSRSLFSP